jgi:hypothetical protein
MDAEIRKGGRTGVPASDWDVLGLRPGASPEEIKRAFRRRVKLCHPDLHPGDADAATRMKELTRAYSRLMSRRLDVERSDRMFAARPSPGPTGLSADDPDYRRLMRRYALRDLADRARSAARLSVAMFLILVPLAGLALGGAAAVPHLVRAAAEARSACPEEGREVLLIRADSGQLLLVPLSSSSSR